MITLRGIAWNNTRSYVPLIAASQRFEELHPDVQITWIKLHYQRCSTIPTPHSKKITISWSPIMVGLIIAPSKGYSLHLMSGSI